MKALTIPEFRASYNDAHKALAKVTEIDDALKCFNDAAWIKEYARRAKDGDLIALATRVQRYAQRRVGELMAELRAAGKLAKGMKGQPGPGRGKRGASAPPRFDYPTYADMGIDKDLAKRARRDAAKPLADFEADVTKAERAARASASDDKTLARELRDEKLAAKRAARKARERALGEKQLASPTRRYGVVLADVPWPWETWQSETGLDRHASSHYPTMTVEQIKNMASFVDGIAAKDCALFFWTTGPHLAMGLEVIEVWGFEYVTEFIWLKDKTGMGYWNRNKHETLLVAKRGNVPCPAEGDQWPSTIEAPRGRHSEKPAVFYELIEAYFPSLPKIELFARKARPGWDAWGNEAPMMEEAA